MAIGNWIVVQKLSSPNEYLWDDDARDDVGMRVCTINEWRRCINNEWRGCIHVGWGGCINNGTRAITLVRELGIFLVGQAMHETRM